jgi:hypothetical protein
MGEFLLLSRDFRAGQIDFGSAERLQQEEGRSLALAPERLFLGLPFGTW